MRTYEGSRKCNDINIYYLCKNDGIGNLLGGGGKGDCRTGMRNVPLKALTTRSMFHSCVTMMYYIQINGFQWGGLW